MEIAVKMFVVVFVEGRTLFTNNFVLYLLFNFSRLKFFILDFNNSPPPSLSINKYKSLNMLGFTWFYLIRKPYQDYLFLSIQFFQVMVCKCTLKYQYKPIGLYVL